MNIKAIEKNGVSIAVVNSEKKLVTDVGSALDLVMSVQYETGCHRIALNKEAIAEEFFILSTRLAGDIIQKFVTYKIQFAIIGDFSGYTSKPLKDFIYESNQGRDLFFVPDEAEAAEKLSRFTGL